MINGIFTTIKVQDGTPLFFPKHERRLLTHAKATNLPYPTNLNQHIIDFITDNNLTNCALRVTIARNTLEPLIQQRPLPEPQTDIAVITLPDTRDAHKIYKTTDRRVNEQAKAQAEKKNTNDALFTQKGKLVESTIANIFSLNQHGQLITPPIIGRGLNGTTRQVIMEHSPVIEEEIPVTTDGPLVLVNSLRLTTIKTLDGRELQNGKQLFQMVKQILTNAEQSEE